MWWVMATLAATVATGATAATVLVVLWKRRRESAPRWVHVALEAAGIRARLTPDDGRIETESGASDSS